MKYKKQLIIILLFLISLIPVLADTPYNKTSALDTNYWFNTDALDTESTAGVFMYFFLIFILAFLVIVSEITKLPFLAFITSIMVFFFSFLFFTKISAIFGVGFVVVGFVYMIRSVTMAF